MFRYKTNNSDRVLTIPRPITPGDLTDAYRKQLIGPPWEHTELIHLDVDDSVIETAGLEWDSGYSNMGGEYHYFTNIDWRSAVA